jgi:hypothetical protein
MGRIASFYYMKHQTMATFAQQLRPGMDVRVRPLDSAVVACQAIWYRTKTLHLHNTCPALLLTLPLPLRSPCCLCCALPPSLPSSRCGTMKTS